MLAVTETAKDKLKDTIPKLTDEPGFALRIVVSPADEKKLDLVLGREQEGDQVVEGPEGDTVLLIEPELSGKLDGVVFDYVENEGGTGFTMHKAAREG